MCRKGVSITQIVGDKVLVISQWQSRLKGDFMQTKGKKGSDSVWLFYDGIGPHDSHLVNEKSVCQDHGRFCPAWSVQSRSLLARSRISKYFIPDVLAHDATKDFLLTISFLIEVRIGHRTLGGNSNGFNTWDIKVAPSSQSSLHFIIPFFVLHSAVSH